MIDYENQCRKINETRRAPWKREKAYHTILSLSTFLLESFTKILEQESLNTLHVTAALSVNTVLGT